MTLKIRLYFSDKIQSDLVSHLTKEQSHYVKDVMRLEKGVIYQFLMLKANGMQLSKIMKKRALE